jgi:hypothetical protein
MKIVLLSVVFILGLTATAQARLGENADQLVARYGQPLKEDDTKSEGVKVASAEVSFQKGGFQIDVTLVDGISVAESFNKLNGDGFTVGEVRTLLAANGQGFEWAAPVVVEGEKVWLRDDSATATLNAAGTVLVIKSKELISEQNQARKAEERPSLDGF